MEQAVRQVWIDPSWLSWEAWGQRVGVILNDVNFRPYEMHQHVCEILASDPNEFHRVDAITTLRRVVDRRVKELKKTYQFRKLPIRTKPKPDLKLLEYLGIIRPLMLDKLIALRDALEHEDSKPPSKDECLMFADLVWYFLRSTDNLVHAYVEDIYFEPPQMHDRNFPRVIVEFRPSFNDPRIWARLELPNFAYEPRADWLRVDAAEIKEYDRAYPNARVTEEGDREKTGLSPMDVRGELRGTDEQMKHIYTLYFTLSHFS